MKPLLAFSALVAALTAGTLSSGGADVVINEIMYRPGTGYPEGTTREFIELHNPTTAAIDVSGWALTSGAGYTIPTGTTIAAGGYLVIAASPAQVQTVYGISGVLGPWTAGATLSNNSDKITLSKPGPVAGTWEKVDEVSYASEGDWAVRVREGTFGGWAWSTPANGGNKSMELRNPALTNNNGQNWAPSIATAGATPGAVNSVSSANIAPIIQDVKHSPAVPKSADNVTVSCRVSDETPADGLTATLFWRLATSATPGPFQAVPMAGDASGSFAAVLLPQANLAIVEFYVSATDGVNTRTWPAPTSEGQNANCQYQVANEAANNVDTFYRLVLTAAENAAFEATAANNPDSDRQFNQTLIVQRGADTTIRYRASMRIRGASSRAYQFKPMRITLPNDDPWEGISSFNLNPRSSYLQFLGMRLFQAAGLPGSDVIPVELRRNGTELTTSGGSSPDYGKWVRVEEVNAQAVHNHWPTAAGGNLYGESRPEAFWRSNVTAPATPDGKIDGWSKQNNNGANDWSDLIAFFTKWQTNAAPHFPGAPAGDVAAGTWNGTAFTTTEMSALETVADLDEWARWFAVMTILQDNETNISNGVDDDYTAYFLPSPGGQRRFELAPHDQDTIFGLGDSPLTPQDRGLFDMTDDGAVFKPLLPLFGNNSTPGNAAFRAKYFTAIRDLLGGPFNASTTEISNPPFYQFVDSHLTGWAPAATISAIKTFATQRQSYLLGLIGQPATTFPAGTSTVTVTSPHGTLMIHEVLANNVSAVDVGGAFPDIIELRNTGAVPVDLSGMSLTDDPAVKAKFIFPAGSSIPADGYFLVYADLTAGTPHTGFGLDQGGETVQLYDTLAAGQGLIDSISFGAQPANYSVGRTGATLDVWTLCIPTLGAANTAVTAFAPVGGVRINEWLGNVGYQFDDDFVELYNPFAQPVALGGMAITYGPGNAANNYTLPLLSFMAPASFLAIEAKGSAATPGNATELPFKFSSSFGAIALLGQNGVTVDRVDVVAQTSDTSTGRTPNGAVTLTRFGLPTSLASPGASNVAPPASVLALMNGLRVTELLYTPTDLEFIELQNIGASVLDLSGVRFTRGVTYTFPAGSTLAPGAFIVVCKNRDAFTTQFGGAVPLAPGVFSGTLADGGETIALRLPLPWEVNILRFAYDPAWYPATASGYSLTVANARTTAPGDWGQRETWSASAALYGTPGSEGPPTITSLLTVSTIVGDAFQYQITATKSPSSFGAAGLPAGLAINTATGLINGTPGVAGTFPVTLSATNASGTDSKTLTITIAASGPFASFAWAPVGSPQYAGVPFDVTVTATDAQGRAVASFNNSPALSAFKPGGGTGASVVITECVIADIDGWELQNVSDAPVNTSGWFVVMNRNIDGGVNSIQSQTVSLPASLAPGEIFYRDEDPNDAAHYFGYTIAWGSTGPSWAMLVDNTGAIRDFFAWGYTQADIQTINVTAKGFSLSPSAQSAWSGAGEILPAAGLINGQGLIRSGSDDHQNETDFTVGTASLGARNAGLTLPFPGSTLPVPVAPAALATFVNGVWRGQVTISQVASGVKLRANDGAGHTANSGAFDVVIPPTPAIISPTSALAVVGQVFSYQISTNTPAASYTASPLPPGLSFDAATGLISGTPTVADTSSINLSATNSSGTGNAAVSLEVQADADGDGMGDGWETAHGLNPGLAADASGDLDGDGFTNLEEWLAGTSPDDSNSRFAIISEAISGADVQITWRSVPGKRYRVLARADLLTGSWIDLASPPVAATAATKSFTHAGGKSGSMGFYRVEVVP